MSNSKLIFYAVLNSIASFLYISAVAWLLSNGEKFFGKDDSFLMPAAFLLIFVVSATIVGGLVLGRPIHLYLENNRKEAINLLIYTVAFLIIIAGIVLLLI